MGRKIGYARVSTAEQNLEMQIDALKAAGCVTVYSEKVSSVARHRPQLRAMLADLKDGDTLTIWKLDRLGRSLPNLIQTVEDLRARGVMLQSLTEGFETHTVAGKLLFHVIGALAEMERSLISERVLSGMGSARQRGQHLGRPPKVTREMYEMANQMRDQGKSWAQVQSATGVNRTSILRAAPKYSESFSANVGM